MAKSIHDALWEWMQRCEGIARLFFNFSSAESGDTVIGTAGDTITEEYIDGSQLRRYSFELIRYLPYTTKENDDGNIAMLDEVESIAEWIRAQNEAGELPELPPGYSAESVTVLENYMGYVAAQGEDRAKYMMPIAMDYMKG